MARDKRRTSVGVLFWIAFILLVLVIFLANRTNIQNVLDSTGIVDVVRDRLSRDDADPADDQTGDQPGREPGGNGESSEPSGDVATPTDTTPGGASSRDGSPDIDPSPATTTDGQLVVESDARDGNAGSETRDEGDSASDSTGGNEGQAVERTEEERSNEERSAPEAAGDPAKPHKRMAALYYIRVTDDGRTFPQKVVRAVYYADSPLTETINTLLSGPSSDELSNGLLNLIPESTQLISAYVRDGVAYLNFNERFRFNPMGAEGTVAQLQQIIFSSTEFPTVQRVQFLIEGEKIEYLGGEGIYVGEPLGRDAFS